MLKIFANIIKYPTKTEKYGNLHAQKMKQKLSECKPAEDMLLYSGFTLSNDTTRLIWKNTNENIIVIKYIHDTLTSIINPTTASNTKHNQQQTQLIFNQMQINATQTKKQIDSETNKDPSTSSTTNTIQQIQPDIQQMVSKILMSQPLSFGKQQSTVSYLFSIDIASRFVSQVLC